MLNLYVPFFVRLERILSLTMAGLVLYNGIRHSKLPYRTKTGGARDADSRKQNPGKLAVKTCRKESRETVITKRRISYEKENQEVHGFNYCNRNDSRTCGLWGRWEYNIFRASGKHCCG